jgi:hypothetical protein
MTHAEYLAAHAMAGQHSGYTVAATLDLFARHGMARAPLDALSQRGNTYRRGVPDLPEHFDRLLDGDRLRIDWPGVGGEALRATACSQSLSLLRKGCPRLPSSSTATRPVPE